MTYDENEDKDIEEILNSVKKSRRSPLVRELIRLGWKVKQQDQGIGVTTPVTKKEEISREPRREPDLGSFRDE